MVKPAVNKLLFSNSFLLNISITTWYFKFASYNSKFQIFVIFVRTNTFI
jgi:hypothetical protein